MQREEMEGKREEKAEGRQCLSVRRRVNARSAEGRALGGDAVLHGDDAKRSEPALAPSLAESDSHLCLRPTRRVVYRPGKQERKMEVTHRLTDTQKNQFFEEGYVMVPNIFTPEELEPLCREIDAIVDAAALELLAEGKITELRDREPFETRLTRLVADHPELWDTYRRAIEGKAGGGHRGPEMFRILTHPRLLDVMECLVGPEIVASSVYRIRPKVPGQVRGEVPWHQDSGYFARHCDDSLIITCWFPLVDATVENGCLQVLPKAHRQGVVTHHTGGRGGYLVIEEDDLPVASPQAVFVPVPLGGALLMTNLTPHSSEANRTEVTRWSIDLRYQSREVPTNVFQEPEKYRADAPPIEIACYAPEADFCVRSRQHPEAVHTYAQYVERRTRYEAAALPSPQRGWQPVK
jgi:phytanoyl-CoA hydroxylase